MRCSRYALVALILLFAPGCASLAASIAGNALGGDSSAFSYDDDPDLVRDAIPFGLKTIEALLAKSPTNDNLLLAASSGFAQYAIGFVQRDAELLEDTDPAAAREKYARAKRLLVRAREYGLRGLVDECPRFRSLLETDPAAAAACIDDDDENISFLYWTAASWAAFISLSKDDMGALGDLPKVEALMGRALALAPDWNDGAIHEFYVIYDSRSESLGGSLERAHRHMDRVLELTQGQKIGPYVTWAESVAVQQQDRKLFDEMLDRALGFNIDEAPRFRLVNTLAQQRARWLKSRAGDLFLEE